MLSGIVNAARHGSPKNSERDINGLLAAVSGIGATDETEGMLATQMVPHDKDQAALEQVHASGDRLGQAEGEGV
jgi:hypothetical protein